ncbi:MULTISPECIES: phage capsid protein [unclassified Acinetobacter]|uniref:phage capsid protein n=1 Tax=unclassified Acinetobacter TaxID=196816 RepID=UPI0015D156BD|nr:MULTISPECIES: phage capsid protein [unclassified Acinetobacter]
MATSWDTIDSVFVKQYADTYLALLEQKESKLLGTVNNIGAVTGVGFSCNELGSLGDNFTTPTRFGETQYTDVSFASRFAVMSNFDNFTRIDINELYKLKAQPQDEILQRLHAKWNRKIDSVIYNGLIGTAQRKENGSDVYTQVTLPADHVLGDVATPITKQLLIDIRTKFLENDVDEEITLLYNPSMLNAILADKELTSADYIAARMLQNGQISDFLGFKWVMYNGMTSTDGLSATGVAYTRSALQLGMNIVSPLKIVEVETQGRMLSIGEKRATGCVRTDEKKVIAFKFKI